MKTTILPLIILALTLPQANAKGGIGEIFGTLIEKSAGHAVGKSLADTQSIESAIIKMAEELNKRLPMAIDKDTKWDHITAGPGRRFTYSYTFVTATTRDIDKAYFHQTMRAQIINDTCTKPEMKIFFTNGITIGYSYKAADGIFIDKIDITPKDCGIS